MFSIFLVLLALIFYPIVGILLAKPMFWLVNETLGKDTYFACIFAWPIIFVGVLIWGAARGIKALSSTLYKRKLPKNVFKAIARVEWDSLPNSGVKKNRVTA